MNRRSLFTLPFVSLIARPTDASNVVWPAVTGSNIGAVITEDDIFYPAKLAVIRNDNEEIVFQKSLMLHRSDPGRLSSVKPLEDLQVVIWEDWPLGFRVTLTTDLPMVGHKLSTLTNYHSRVYSHDALCIVWPKTLISFE